VYGVRNYCLQKDCLGSKGAFVDIVVLFDIVRQQNMDLLQVNGKLRRKSAVDCLSYPQPVQYIAQVLEKQLQQTTRQFTPGYEKIQRRNFTTTEIHSDDYGDKPLSSFIKRCSWHDNTVTIEFYHPETDKFPTLFIYLFILEDHRYAYQYK